MNYKRAIFALLLLLTLILMGGGAGYAAAVQFAPGGQNSPITVTTAVQPTPVSQNRGNNSGDTTAIWIAVAVAVFAAVGGGTALNNKNKKSGRLSLCSEG